MCGSGMRFPCSERGLIMRTRVADGGWRREQRSAHAEGRGFSLSHCQESLINVD